MTAQLPSINEKIYRLANHIAGAKGGLPTEWKDWAEEIETDLRALLAAHEQEPVAWTSQRSLDVNDKITAFTSEESAVDYGKSKAWVNIVPLYAHPALVPAVPDEMTPKQASRAYCGEVRGYRDGWNACRAAMLNGGKSERDKVRAAHAEWSQKTFGNVGPVGPLKHLAKEAIEAADAPDDLSEWADMQFLLWDAQRRAGITDEQINQAMLEKLAVNKAREWPEPKDGEPRLHIQSATKV